MGVFISPSDILAFPHLACCELKHHSLLHYIMSIIMENHIKGPKQETRAVSKPQKQKVRTWVEWHL